MHGMYYTAAGDASLIITFNPIFTVILAAPLLGQPISKKMFIGLFCGFIGVGIVTGWSPNTQINFEDRILGDLLILCASFSWAATTNMTKRLMEGRDGYNNYTALEIVVWYSLIGTIMMTPFGLLLVHHWNREIRSNCSLIVYFLSTIIWDPGRVVVIG